jgi:hypothetical protein
MNIDATTQAAKSATTPEEDPLARVQRDLVGIHASMVEATRNDTTTLPWATREIMEVIRYISRIRQAQ